MDSNVIKHHGVLGMKWGVRRSRKQLEQDQRSRMQRMSDSELRSEINRIRMEKEYMSLTKKPDNPIVKFASDAALQAGRNIAADYLTKYGKKAIESGLGTVKTKMNK